MDKCRDILDALPDYLNNKTTRMQNSAIVRHIAICPSCRKDLALWISTQETLKVLEEVPLDVFNSMFEKLPNDNKTELEKLLETDSNFVAFDLIRYALESVKATYKLARLF